MIDHDPRVPRASQLDPEAPPHLTWVRKGDVIDVMNEVVGRVDPMMVMSPCTTVGKGYYCATHLTHLANLGQLYLHADETAAKGRGTTHHLAVWCHRHHMYEEAEASQIDGFARAEAR